MKIAICDDNAVEREKLVEHIRTYLNNEGLKAQIFAFADGESLLAATKKHYFSVLFLDVYLPGKNGVELALKLRKNGSRAAIIFTTVTTDFMAESFKVWAVHYLIKPVTAEGVFEAMTRAASVTDSDVGILEVVVARHHERIPFDDIHYIAANGRICDIHTQNGIYRPYSNIKDLADKLRDPRFIHCHRSYIINLDHAFGVQATGFAVRGDDIIPIRRGSLGNMRKLYEAWRIDKLKRRP